MVELYQVALIAVFLTVVFCLLIKCCEVYCTPSSPTQQQRRPTDVPRSVLPLQVCVYPQPAPGHGNHSHHNRHHHQVHTVSQGRPDVMYNFAQEQDAPPSYEEAMSVPVTSVNNPPRR